LLVLALWELARLYEGNRGSLGRAWFWFGLGFSVPEIWDEGCT
jgi:hypothetical protein